MKSNVRTFALATMLAVAASAFPHSASADSVAPSPTPACKGTHIPTVTIHLSKAAIALPFAILEVASLVVSAVA